MKLLCLLVVLVAWGCGPQHDGPPQVESEDQTFSNGATGAGGFTAGGQPGGNSGVDNPGGGSTDQNGGNANTGTEPPDGDVVSQFDDPDTGCGFGTIYGLICSKNEQMFVNGATVWVEAEDCNGNPVKPTVTSDSKGFYILKDVPNGLQTVHIEKDGWTKEYKVQVSNGKISDVTGVGHKECFQVVQCVETEQIMPVESKAVSGLADIVVFIDTSGSMKQEAKWVQENVNSFAQYIGGQQVDYRVVLIGKGFDLCVPPPLGGPNCTDGPQFRHIKEKVNSKDGLSKVIETYPLYKDFLRKGATTNFLAVTDDNSKKSASWFTAEANKLKDPGFSKPFVFHSIVAYGDVPFVGCIGGAFGGVEYLKLTDQTGGAKFPVCEKDWSSIFGKMAETVVNSVISACGYKLPNAKAVAAGNTYELTYKNGNGNMVLPKVGDPSQCGSGGWYFDNEEKPEKLMLCQASCNMLADGDLHLDVMCQ